MHTKQCRYFSAFLRLVSTAMNAQRYSGLLGAEASRFIGQQTTDIHLDNFFDAAVPVKHRQHSYGVAEGITILDYEHSQAMHVHNPIWPPCYAQGRSIAICRCPTMG